MRILFASSNHLPRIGGITVNTHYLASRLKARGHEVGVYTSLSHRFSRVARLMRGGAVLGRSVAPDKRLGYSVFRTVISKNSFEDVCRAFHPDVIVINVGSGMESFCRLVRQCTGRHHTVAYFHDLEAVSLLNDASFSMPDVCLGVSEPVTAASSQFCKNTRTVLPLVEYAQYRCTMRRKAVLFVNPVIQKGLNIAWALAESRRDIPFIFLESWPLDRASVADLRRHAGRLDNVTIRRVIRDPRRMYADARILLAPYSRIEGYGRVVAEAQSLGIPVLASDTPGLRHAAGDGGLFVDLTALISVWADALSELWDDQATYWRLACRAREYAARPEADPRHVVSTLEYALRSPSA